MATSAAIFIFIILSTSHISATITAISTAATSTAAATTPTPAATTATTTAAITPASSATVPATSSVATAPSATVPATASVAAAAASDAEAARELVRQSSWGVASNLDFERNNAPYGNPVSYADGGTGVPYFYLTPLDRATAKFAAVDDRTSLSLSQYALGTCGDSDPQEPTCIKVTLLGKLHKVAPESEEGTFASGVLFKRHPRFSRVPAIAKFELYKLNISAVVIINSYIGSPKTLQPVDYFFM